MVILEVFRIPFPVGKLGTEIVVCELHMGMTLVYIPTQSVCNIIYRPL